MVTYWLLSNEFDKGTWWTNERKLLGKYLSVRVEYQIPELRRLDCPSVYKRLRQEDGPQMKTMDLLLILEQNKIVVVCLTIFDNETLNVKISSIKVTEMDSHTEIDTKSRYVNEIVY